MLIETLDVLRCPYCGGALSLVDSLFHRRTADEIHDVVVRAFPGATIGWKTDTKRQAIVDSWPADVDDAAARHDWGFAPQYDFDRAFREYLIPTIRTRYA